MAPPDPTASRAPGRAPGRATAREPVRIMRIVARLNVGGPTIQTALLTHGLEDASFHSLLVTGTVGEHEGDMSYVAREMGVQPYFIAEIGSEVAWKKDVVAFWKLRRLVRGLEDSSGPAQYHQVE